MRGPSINLNIHHSKVFSSGQMYVNILYRLENLRTCECSTWNCGVSTWFQMFYTVGLSDFFNRFRDYRFFSVSRSNDILSKRIEYILERNLDNPSVWILSVPFSLKGSSKSTNHVNVHKLYAVEYINTVCSQDYSFQFWIF